MRWSINLGSIAGTSVRIHLTFVLFLLWIGVSQYRLEGAAAAWDTLAFISLLFFCVVLHEFGHILMARRFGIKTSDVTLFPIGGIANMERIPEKPSQELLVAIAGPTVNLAIAAGLLVALGSTITAEDLVQLDIAGSSLVMRLAAANLILMGFNLIPAFPMDGGRVLRALLAMRMRYTDATRTAATIGQGFAFILGFLGFISNPVLIFIAIFIYIAAGAEADAVSIRDIAHDLTVEDAIITSIVAIPENARIGDAVEHLLNTAMTDFPVVDQSGRPSGIVTRGAIVAALKEHGETFPVINMMGAADAVIREKHNLSKALDLFGTTLSPVLIVTNDVGEVTGLLSRAAINDVAMIRSLRPNWDFHHRTLRGNHRTRAVTPDGIWQFGQRR
jgi:Zn-dependent protease/CBS domain-containing protein